MAKNKDRGQKQPQQDQGQEDMQNDRSDREAGKPLQLDDEKMNEKQGGQSKQAGQHQGNG